MFNNLLGSGHVSSYARIDTDFIEESGEHRRRVASLSLNLRTILYRDTMTSTGFNPNPEWHWPQDAHLPSAPQASPGRSPMPGTFHEEPSSAPKPNQPPKQKPSTTPKPRKHWPPRTCRYAHFGVHSSNLAANRGHMLPFASRKLLYSLELSYYLGEKPRLGSNMIFLAPEIVFFLGFPSQEKRR